MPITLSRLMPWLGLALLLLAAYALRLHRLDHVPLRGDEGYTAIHGTTAPLTEGWALVMETQPNPGMLAAYWLWSSATGLSEFALRYINLLTNVAGLAVMVALTHRIQRNWQTAALVGLLWLLHPFFIWHSQDARHYAFTTLLTPLSFYLFLRALDSDRQHTWLAYLVVQTVALYVNIIDAYWVVVQGFYLLSLHSWDLIKRASVVWGLMALLLIPLAYQVYLVRVVNDYQGTTNPASVTLFFEEFVATLLFGDNRWPFWTGLLVMAFLVVGALAFSKRRVLVLGWMLIPLALLYLFSTGTDIFQPRYVINTAPALLLALAVTIQGSASWLARQLHMERYRYALALVLVGAVLMVDAVEVYDYFYRDPPKAADWRGLTTYLRERTTADDLIISDSIDPALEYYYSGPAEILFIPDENPDPERYIPDAFMQHEAVFLLAGRNTGDAARYLQDHAQAIPGDDWPGISQFRAWDVKPDEIEQPLDLRLGEVAILRGATLVGDTSLLLYWEALAQTEREHSVLLHIEASPDTPPIAVLDHGIAGTLVSTRTWTPGTIYRDPVPLPELPSGTYTVLVGMYPTGTENFLLAPADETEDGRYTLLTIEISN